MIIIAFVVVLIIMASVIGLIIIFHVVCLLIINYVTGRKQLKSNDFSFKEIECILSRLFIVRLGTGKENCESNEKK